MFRQQFLKWSAPAVAVLALFVTSEMGWAQHRGGGGGHHAAPAHAAAHHAAYHAPTHAAAHHAVAHPAYHAAAFHHAAAIHHAVAAHTGFRGGFRAPAHGAVAHAYARPYAHGYAHPYGYRGYGHAYGYRGYAHPYGYRNWSRYPYRYGWGGYGGYWGYPYGYASYGYPSYYYLSNYGYPYYSDLSDTYPDVGSYDDESPSSYFVGPSAVLGDTSTYDVGPPASTAVAATATATLRVVLPSYGTVSIDSYKTEQGAGARDFVTPPLTVGQDFTYHVSARFTQYGMDLTRSKDVIIHAGEVVTVDFTQPNG